MKKLLIFCACTFALSLSAQSMIGKSLDEIARNAQEKAANKTSVDTDFGTLKGLTNKKTSDKQLEKQAKEEEAKLKDEEDDKDKKDKKKISGFKSISDRFAEATTRYSEYDTSSNKSAAETTIDLAEPPSGKKRAQPPKSISERFAEATTRYSGYESHAKDEIAAGATVATTVKKEKPNSDHLTPISGIAFGADIKTLRGPTATKEPDVFQMTLTNQYFIFFSVKVYIDSDNRVCKVVGEKDFNTPELAKKQYAALIPKIQGMYSIPPKTVTEGKVTEYAFSSGDKITLELDLTATRPRVRLTAESSR